MNLIQTAEQSLETIRSLPKPERKKLFELIEVEKSKDIETNEELERKNKKFRQALRWIDEHKEEFDGQFVLLEGGKLIAHGTNPKELYAAARAIRNFNSFCQTSQG